jgi:hypothetical protein
LIFSSCLKDSSVLRISSGSISGNISDDKRGGICLENYTLVVAEDAYICGNQAKETGGGIIAIDNPLKNPTKLIIEGHPKISGDLPNEVVIDEG